MSSLAVLPTSLMCGHGATLPWTEYAFPSEPKSHSRVWTNSRQGFPFGTYRSTVCFERIVCPSRTLSTCGSHCLHTPAAST